MQTGFNYVNVEKNERCSVIIAQM